MEDLNTRYPAGYCRFGDIVFDKYKLTRFIAFGPMSEVWRVDDVLGTGSVLMRMMFEVGRSWRAEAEREVAAILDGAGPRASRHLSWAFGVHVHLQRQCLLSQFYDMNVRTLLETDKIFPLPFFQIRAILWQVCMGIEVLHSLDIVHNNIKPENVVFVDNTLLNIRDIDSAGRGCDKVVLRDIGVKIVNFEYSVTSHSENLHHICNAGGYCSPELYGRVGWNFPVDVFSIGCLAYELSTRIPMIPQTEDLREYMLFMERAVGSFGAPQAQDIGSLHPDMFRTAKGKIARVKFCKIWPNARKRVLAHVSETKQLKKRLYDQDVKDLIDLCTKVDPQRRPTVASVLKHCTFDGYSKVKSKV